ncbi:DNA polymerase III subunit gamma/tau [Desulfobacterales bacterium HSG16]|nr:DNA polymerase III subunit gamma/tau [Desulfobacterales bacterium HSG16]
MSYLVLARKYRPQTFEDVVAQTHVTHTLKNAIEADRVAHAILFSGPRGTGKTTVARIMAKAMNCEQGPASEPCNQCQSCKEITSGSAVDVFEIDGASNNGVDNIRELRDNIRYMPAHSRYKIYIIDEVHMLSTAAFNALLKTLEEPPPHIMFFFATTESNKIPVTILSRCQRHDLKRLESASIINHMASLCLAEGKKVDHEGLEIVAKESGGCMRDALSLLDQVLTCADGEITSKQIIDILGVIDSQILFDISDAILKQDLAKILEILDTVYERGHSVKELYSSLLGHFRNLLMVRITDNAAKLMDLPAREIQSMKAQANQVSDIYLGRMLDILFKEEASVLFSAHSQIALEMAFIRMFQTRPGLPIDTLIEKLDHLAGNIGIDMKVAVPVTPVQKGQKTEPPVPESVPAAPVQTEQIAEPPVPEPVPAAPVQKEQIPEPSVPEPVPAAPVQTEQIPEPSVPEPVPAAPVQKEQIPEPPVPEPVPAARPSNTSGHMEDQQNGALEEIPLDAYSADISLSTPDNYSAPMQAPAPVNTPNLAGENFAAESVNTGSVNPEQGWKRLISRIADQKSLLANCLSQCRLKNFDTGKIEIETSGQAFQLKQINKNMSMIKTACESVFGRKMEVIVTPGKPAENNGQAGARQANAIEQEALSHPLIGAALEIFNGKIVDFKVLNQ